MRALVAVLAGAALLVACRPAPIAAVPTTTTTAAATAPGGSPARSLRDSSTEELTRLASLNCGKSEAIEEIRNEYCQFVFRLIEARQLESRQAMGQQSSGAAR